MPRFPLPDRFEEGDIARFRKSFERVAKANGWTAEQQLASLPLALCGRALRAFEAKETNFKTIADAFDALESEFQSPLDKETALKEFYALRWGVGLSPADYAARLTMLLKTGLPSLGDDDQQRTTVNQFIAGFPSPWEEQLRLLFAGKSAKLSEVVAAANDLVRSSSGARAVCSIVAAEATSHSPELDGLSAKVEELSVQVAAISEALTVRPQGCAQEPNQARWTQKRNSGRVREERTRCYNCSGYGHFARECPTPRNRMRSGNAKAEGRRPTTTFRRNSTSSA